MSRPEHDRRAFLKLGAAGALAGLAAPRNAAAAAPVPLVYDATGTLTVAASIEGRPPKRFIWDTGSARSVLSDAYASELGLPLTAGEVIAGTGGTVGTQTAKAKIDIAGLGAWRIPFLVAPFASGYGDTVGLLGTDVLAREPFSLDYGAGALAWRASRPAVTLPMPMRGFVPAIEARINGAALLLHLDTGSASAPGTDYIVSLTERERELAGVSGEPVRHVSAAGTGGTVVALPVLPLERLELAGRRLDPAYAIIRAPFGYFAAPDAIGFIGNAVLDKLTPYFDYAGGVFGLSA